MPTIQLLKQSSGVLVEHDQTVDDIIFKGIDVNAVTDLVAGIQKQNLLDKTAAAAISGDYDYSGGMIQLPKGITLPASGDEGDIFWKSDTDRIYVSDGTNWQNMGNMESFDVAGDGGGTTQTISEGDTLTIAGGTGVTTTAGATDTVTVDGDDATTTTKGIVKPSDTYFNVTSGLLEIKTGGVPNLQLVNDGITISGDGAATNEVQLGDTFSILGGEGIDTTHAADQITVAGEDASDTNKGIATFNAANFLVTTGDVTIKDGGVANAELVNSSITAAGDGGGTAQTIALGDTLTIAGGTGITSTAGATDTVTVAGDDATATTKGIASFNTANFAVTTGDVTIKAGGVANAELANDGITFTGDSGGSGETQLGDIFDIAGGTGIDTTWTTDQVSVAIDSTVATEAYVDSKVAGLAWKEAVIDGVEYIKTTAGAPTGTATSGEKCLNTADNTVYGYTTGWDTGTALSSGDRYINKDDGSDITGNSGTYTADDNIYEYDGTSTTGTAPADGDALFIETGKDADTAWNYTGTVWTQFTGAAQLTAGAGLTKSGNTLDVVAADTSITVNADDLQVNLNHNFTWTGNHDFTGTFSLGSIQLLATATQLNSLVDDSMVDNLHRHSELSAPDGAPDAIVQVDNAGQVGINTHTPDRMLEVLDASYPQLRLTQTDASKYTDFQTDADGNLEIEPVGTSSIDAISSLYDNNGLANMIADKYDMYIPGNIMNPETSIFTTLSPAGLTGKKGVVIDNEDNLQYSRGSHVSADSAGVAYENLHAAQGTLEFWIRANWDGDDGEGHYIFSETGSNATTNRFRLLKNSSDLLVFRIDDKDSTSHYVSYDISSWTAGTWYHIVATWDFNNNAIEVYTAGTSRDATPNNALSNDSMHAVEVNWDIGHFDSSQQFNGAIYGRIYSTPASASQVSDLYNSGNGTTNLGELSPYLIWEGDFSNDSTDTVFQHSGQQITSSTENSVTATEDVSGRWVHGDRVTVYDGCGFKPSGDIFVDTGVGSLSGTNIPLSSDLSTHAAVTDLDKVGVSLDFDGTEYVNAGNDASLEINDTITIETWFKSSDIASDQALASKYGGSSNWQYQLLINYRKVNFKASFSGDYGDTLTIESDPLSDNKWIHLVAVYDRNNKIAVYINGVEYSTAAPDKALASKQSIETYIGRRSSNYLIGSLSEIRVYSKALSADDALWLATNPKPIKTEIINNTTAVDADIELMHEYYQKDLTDYSSNTNDGIHSGTVDYHQQAVVSRSLICDGSQELGGIGGWILEQVASSGNGKDTSNVKFDMQGVKIVNDGAHNGNFLYQTTNVGANENYLMRGWGKTDGNADNVSLLLAGDGGFSGQMSSLIASTSWSFMEIVIKTTGTQTELEARAKVFDSDQSGDTGYFDQLQLYENAVDNGGMEGTYDDESGGGGGTVNVAPEWDAHRIETDGTDTLDECTAASDPGSNGVNPHSGGSAQYADVADVMEGIEQDITTLTVGEHYSYSAWVYIVLGSIEITSNGTDTSSVALSSTTGSWVRVSGVFEYTGPGNKFTIRADGGAAEFYIDDVSIVRMDRRPASTDDVYAFETSSQKIEADMATSLLKLNQQGTGKLIDLQDSGTSIMKIEDGGDVSFNTNQLFLDNSTNQIGINTITPTGTLEIVDSTQQQLRLSHTEGSAYADFEVDGNGFLNISSSGSSLTIENTALLFTAATDGIAQYDAVCITDDNIVDQADADDIATGRVIGLAREAFSAGNTGGIVTDGGILEGAGSDWTAGSPIFLSTVDPGGGLKDTVPTGTSDVIIQVGIAKNSTDLFVQIGQPITLA